MSMVYLKAILALGILGGLFGAALALAARKFATESDPRVDRILESLPGANCGACGFAGCQNLASAIAGGKAPVNACPVGGQAVADKVAGIMGVEPVASLERKIARVMCGGTQDKAQTRFEYEGVQDCRAALLVSGGPKACMWGCLGFGTCVRACPFGALTMGPGGLPIVDEGKCTGCGKCVEACPRGIMELIPESRKVRIACRSCEKGAAVRKVCKVGCIACGICVKSCPQGAITLVDNLARIDYEKCDNCGVCVDKCPTKCIIMLPEGTGKIKSSEAVSA